MAPRKQVDDLPGVTSTSAPSTSVQGAIAFAPRDNALLDLAQSLKGINRQLGDYADKVVEQQNSALVEEGRRMAMLDDAKSFKQYVEKGGEPMASPWVVYGYKQQKGRVLGQSYQAFIADKKLNWAGSGSDDIDGQALVNELPKWRQEFLQSQGEVDPVEMTGFDAYAVPEEDNMLRQHIAEARQTATNNLSTQIYNEFYNLMGTPGIKREELFARFDEIYNRQSFIGLRKEVGPLLLKAIGDYAENSGDVGMVDIVKEYSRKDAATGQVIPVMKNTMATAALDKATLDAQAAAIRRDNIRKQQEDEAKAKATDDQERKIIQKLVTNRAPLDPFDEARDALAVGADAKQVINLTQGLNNALEAKNTKYAKDRLNSIFFSIMTQPLPEKDRKEYLKEISLVGDASDIAAVERLWDQYVSQGKTLFTEYPELEAMAATAAGTSFGGTSNPIDETQYQKAVAKAARTVLNRNVPPEKFVDEVKKVFELERKKIESQVSSFAPLSDMSADVNGVPTSLSRPQAPKQSTASTPLQPVFTVAEIRGLGLRTREKQDELLAAKPLYAPNVMYEAYVDILRGNQSPAAKNLIAVMSSIGIDTSKPAVALKILMERGQKRHYQFLKSKAANQPQQKTK